jgi:hypothetical protein
LSVGDVVRWNSAIYWRPENKAELIFLKIFTTLPIDLFDLLLIFQSFWRLLGRSAN